MANTNLLGSYADASGSGLQFRNLLINGDFRIWQRGTSFNTVASSTYTADRWMAWGPLTSVAIAGTQNNRLTFVTAGSSNGIAQRIETAGGNFLAGKTYTISALVTCTSADLIITTTYRNGNTFLSTIQSANVSSQVTAGQASLVKTTFTLANAPTDFANTNCIQVSLECANANTVTLHNVQFEAGPVATPFEQRPIGLELALCQRYYQVYTDASGQNYFVGRNSLGERLLISVQYGIRLRASGNVTLTNINTGGTVELLSNNSNGAAFRAVSTYAGLDNGAPRFTFAADAEL